LEYLTSFKRDCDFSALVAIPSERKSVGILDLI